MEIQHKESKQHQTVSKEDFAVLEREGYAKNYTVISEDDYEPEELKLNKPAKASKPAAE